MRFSRRRLCSVLGASVATVAGTATAQTNVAVRGTVRSAAGADMSGVELRFSHVDANVRRTTTLSSNGEFNLTLGDTGTYRVTLSNGETPTDGVPVIYAFENVALEDTTVNLDFTVPRAYDSQIRCVDPDGNPVDRLPVNFRADNGTGGSPGLYTTTEQGLVKRFGADEPGVNLAGSTQIEVQPPATPDDVLELDTVSVSQQAEFELTVENPDSYTYRFQLIEADPDAGFHFPYFLYSPRYSEATNGDTVPTRPFVVGFRLKDLDTSREQNIAAGREAIMSGRVRAIAGVSRAPGLVALLPTNPPDQSFELLDQNSLQVTEPPYERLDRQLLSMIDDARQRLEDQPYATASDIHLLGFSDAGRMVDQFTALHPDRVNAASSGGNGFATIPQSRLDNDIPRMRSPSTETLPWPVGTAGLEELIGESFDSEAWLDVTQYRYIGAEDQGDPAQLDHPSEYIHAKTYRHFGKRRQQLLLDIFGWRQVDERFATSREIFHNVGADAEFRAYEGVGHSTPENVQRDVTEFHRRAIQAEYGPAPETETPTESRPTTDEESEAESIVSVGGPGFGIPSALGALVGASYLLWSRPTNGDSERGD